MSALLDKIKKNSTIEDTATLKASKIFGKKDVITTPVPMLNVALSGDPDGGLTPGLTVLAGPSKHFKTLFALVMAASFLKKYPDGVLIFYDNEFGSPTRYFESLNIDMERVIYSPITTIEQLKFDISNQLAGLERNDKVCIVVDSVGNLASNKEVEDALNEKLVADMTRAKALKSLFRVVTPHLTLKDIPMVVINHTYKEQGMFPKDIVSGGTGIYYSADNVWIIGRRQDKDDKTKKIDGYDFVINVDKSRFVKEKSQVPISVSWENGINRWSGLLEESLEFKLIYKPQNGKFSLVDTNTKWGDTKFSEDDINSNDELWEYMLSKSTLKEKLRDKYYNSSGGTLLSMDEIEEELE